MTTVIREIPPIRHDFTWKQGADWNVTIKLKEDDRVTVKVTTDYEMTMTIKSAQNGETYATLIIGTGIEHTPAAGQFNISRTAAEIAAYDFTAAVYDIIIEDDLGGKMCPFYGEIMVMP